MIASCYTPRTAKLMSTKPLPKYEKDAVHAVARTYINWQAKMGGKRVEGFYPFLQRAFAASGRTCPEKASAHYILNSVKEKMLKSGGIDAAKQQTDCRYVMVPITVSILNCKLQTCIRFKLKPGDERVFRLVFVALSKSHRVFPWSVFLRFAKCYFVAKTGEDATFGRKWKDNFLARQELSTFSHVNRLMIQ